MELIWSQESLEKLLEIEEYIARDNPERAGTFVDELVDHTETMLAGNTQVGRMVSEISKPEIRELIYRNYRIVYRIGEQNPVVLTIFEGHRLLRGDEINT